MRAVLFTVGIIFTFTVRTSFTKITESPMDAMSKALDFLTSYGYMEPTPSNAYVSADDNNFVLAVKEMQRVANLPVTGKLDAATRQIMTMPRCGVPDKHTSSSRSKRYAFFGTQWPKNVLTYKINNYPSKEVNKSDVETIIKLAFKAWTDAACLFISESSKADADFEIGFYSYGHGDGVPFDGPGKVLAHGFFPPYGMLHFDNSETWTNASRLGANLYQVAVHEIGHTLGLAHSSVKSSIMYPYYYGYVPGAHLDPDDITGIRVLYGSCPTTTSTKASALNGSTTTTPKLTTSSTTTPRPITCRFVCG